MRKLIVFFILISFLFSCASTFDAALEDMNSDDAEDRIEAVEVLGCKNNKAAIEPLQKLFMEEKNAHVKVSIAWALENLEASDKYEKFQFVINSLKNEDIKVRRKALEVISELHFQSKIRRIKFVVAALCGALRDNERKVRLKVLRILGEIKDKFAVPAISEVLLNDKD